LEGRKEGRRRREKKEKMREEGQGGER